MVSEWGLNQCNIFLVYSYVQSDLVDAIYLVYAIYLVLPYLWYL